MTSSQWTHALLAWYDTHQRDLPWRRTSDPYAKWVSEIMLQQTQVQTVIPYYERFLSELPDIPSLAQVDDRRLHKLWEGLGYYRRANHLKQAAQILVKNYGSQLPRDYASLLTLPGIGPYTAAALAAMAFNLPYVAMDGNLERVFARILAETEPVNQPATKSRLKKAAETYLDHDRPGDYNQALMDLGSQVCLPKTQPLCHSCPWQSLCLGKKEGLTHLIPRKTPPKNRRQENRTVFLHVSQGHILIRKRPPQGLLAGLWEFPNISLARPSPPSSWTQAFSPSPLALGTYRHHYSHITWHMHAYLITHPHPPTYFHGLWVPLAAITTTYPLPAAFQVYYRRALPHLTP